MFVLGVNLGTHANTSWQTYIMIATILLFC